MATLIWDKFFKTCPDDEEYSCHEAAWLGTAGRLSTPANVCAPLQQLQGEVLILKGFIIYISVPVSVCGIHSAFLFVCLMDCGVLVVFLVLCLFVNYPKKVQMLLKLQIQ